MNLSSKKTALIAGAGLAGLASAVFLEELGYQVTLCERKPVLGGRTISFIDRKTGHTVDNGQHLMIGAYHETLSFLDRIGSRQNVQTLSPTKIPLIDEKGKRHTLRVGKLFPPFNLALALSLFTGLSIKDKWHLLKLFGELRHLRNKTHPFPVEITVSDWLKRFKQSTGALKNFWEPLTLATLNDTPAETTADGLVQVILKSYFAGPNDGQLIFPKEGLSKVFVDPARVYLEQRGCRILSSTSLSHIRGEGDMVTSFKMTDGSELKADLFVSALPPWDLKATLPDMLLEKSSPLRYIGEMAGSPIMSVNLFFDRPVMPETLCGLAGTNTHWFFRKGNGHINAIISSAHQIARWEKEKIIETVWNDLQRVCPTLKNQKIKPFHVTVNTTERATLSSHPGINTKRPSQKVLNNFFVVGDWTKTDLPATIESAIVSASLMKKHVINIPF